MSIEVNGVSLPDIPSEVLEQYPYAVALDFTASYGATTIMLYCSAAPFCYYPAEYPDDIDYALLKTSSVQVTCAYSPSITGSEDWFVGEAEESGGIVVEEYDGGYISISWANHDIAKMDADGNDTGEIYFPSSVSVSYYAAPKSWYDGMAQQVMRLTGTSDKLTTDEMLELLTALNADSDGDTGGGSVTIVPWSTGTDEEIAAMVAAMDAGTISIEDTGWAIGDERTVTLSVMSATGVGENHTEQTVTMVLMDSQHYTLTEATAGGDTKDHFVVGMKNCLAEKGYMNSSNTNSGSWSGCARRAWCNDVFRVAIPETIRGCFKQFKVPTATEYDASSVTETDDYFALFAEKEIFGSRLYSTTSEGAALSQIKWYETSANKVKTYGDGNSTANWWLRSPRNGYTTQFCQTSYSGSNSYTSASSTDGLAPFGCI